MIAWLRRMLHLPTAPKLPTAADRRHTAILAKADRVAARLEDYRRMDGVLVITRKPR